MTGLDVAGLREKWLQQCGPCDGGLPMGCSHPDEDYRPMLADVLDRLEAAEAAVERVWGLAAEWQGTCDAIAITYQDPLDRARAIGPLRNVVRHLRAVLDGEKS